MNCFINILRLTEQEYCVFFRFTTACFSRSLWPLSDAGKVCRKEKVCQVDDTFIIDEVLPGSYLKVAVVFAGTQS